MRGLRSAWVGAEARTIVPDTAVASIDVRLVKETPADVMSEKVARHTLLRAEDTHRDRDKWSYVLLVEELRRLSARPRRDAPELFRRMCFSALISNTDDHPRNHAVIANDQEWKLSPAYDLTPSVPVSVERRDLALVCGDMGRYAHADNLLSQSARFLLNVDDAKKSVDTMEQTIRAKWYNLARAEGVTEKDCEKIAGVFAYPGCRLTSAE